MSKPAIGERSYPEHATDRDKAAFILGMMWGFQCVGWPAHFNDDDKASWTSAHQWADQILSGGAFNPMHVYRVIDLANEEMCLPHATD